MDWKTSEKSMTSGLSARTGYQLAEVRIVTDDVTEMNRLEIGDVDIMQKWLNLVPFETPMPLNQGYLRVS